MTARYASYEDLADVIRKEFADPQATLKELFSRLVFSVLCGNTDDHARNHAAFWDGSTYQLTPAYDICPQSRTGNQAGQAMLISGNENSSKLATCIASAGRFLLDESNSREVIDNQVDLIRTNWDSVCEEANLTEVDKRFFWQRQFLNAYVFE